MNINEMVKKELYAIEQQMGTPLNIKHLKPMIIIDNNQFVRTDCPEAVVYLEAFNAKDVVLLESNLERNDAFNVLSLVGEKSVYCFWGVDNLDKIKGCLVEWGYNISKDTTFFDLKEAAQTFYGIRIESFEDVLDMISFSEEDRDIFEDKSNMMYMLFMDMYNNGYENDMLSLSVEDLIINSDLSYKDNSYKGLEFRKSKSSVDVTLSEMDEFSIFADVMFKYNSDMLAGIENVISKSKSSGVYRDLLNEKATMYRYKRDIYIYTKAMLAENEKYTMDLYRLRFKGLELYCMMEDASVLVENLTDKEELYYFAKELGACFIESTSKSAHSYLLRKNLIQSLYK